jgi:hypothetical protein
MKHHIKELAVMKVDIYRSTRNKSKFLSLPADTDLATFKFPLGFDSDLRNVVKVKTVDVNPAKAPVAMDTGDIARQIDAQGFAVHGATVKFYEA